MGRARDVAGFVGFATVVAGCITAFVLFAFGWPGWRPFIGSAVANLLLSCTIGGLCWAMLPAVAVAACRWHPFNRWTVVLLTMFAAAVGGTGLAVLVARLFDVGESAGALFASTFRTSLPITFVVGIVATLLESSKARLAEAELALRSQQLERERAEKLAAEAQLASLASRVQPHFLFNTLNSIAALIRDNPEQAEETIERLSSLLRASLDENQTVPIEREMKLVGDYLEIQRTRLGSRLRYSLDCESASIGAATVPLFAVQSLVENALKHVAARRQQGVELHVGAHARADEIVLEVSDDGPGFDPESIKAGHGLDSLQGRLRALYGNRGSLEFERTPARMIVRLRIPAA